MDELREYERQRTSMHEKMTALVGGLTEEQFNWRSAWNTWSIADCLMHLVITGETNMRLVDEMIAECKAKGRFGAGPYRHPLLGSLLLWLIEPPYRLKVPTVRELVPPASELRKDVVLGEFLGLLSQWGERLQAAEGLDLAGARRRHLTRAKLSLGQVIALGVWPPAEASLADGADLPAPGVPGVGRR